MPPHLQAKLLRVNTASLIVVNAPTVSKRSHNSRPVLAERLHCAQDAVENEWTNPALGHM